MLESLLVNAGLYLLKQCLHAGCYAFQRLNLLLEGVATHHLNSSVLNVTRTYCKTHGNTLQFIVGKLESGTAIFSVIILDTDAESAKLLDNRLYSLAYLGKLLGSSCRWGL